MLKLNTFNRGFTIIELIITITIISILSSIGYLAVNSKTDADMIQRYVDDVQNRVKDIYGKSLASKGLPSDTTYIKIICNTTVTPKNFFAYSCNSSNTCTQIFFPSSRYGGLSFDMTEYDKGSLDLCITKTGGVETTVGKAFVYMQTVFPYSIFIKTVDNGAQLGEGIDSLIYQTISGTKTVKTTLITN